MFYSESDIKGEFWFNYRVFSQGSLFCDTLIQLVLGFSFILAFYYGFKKDYTFVKPSLKRRKRKKYVGMWIIKGASIVALLGVYIHYNIDRDWLSRIRDINSNTKIIAHRGASLFAPKNTSSIRRSSEIRCQLCRNRCIAT